MELEGIDGAAAWTIQDEGECQASGGVDDSVCDYIQQTDCLDKGACDKDTQSKCYGLVKTTFSNCQMQCFASSHKDKVCGDCLINSMFNTRTVSAAQPDIFSCCGCLDETFAKVNLDKAELAELLASPCKKHSVTNVCIAHCPRLRARPGCENPFPRRRHHCTSTPGPKEALP